VTVLEIAAVDSCT